MASGSAATAARKRAREQRIKINADQVAREQRIEDAATEFFLAHEELTRAVSRADAAKARALHKLGAEGESQERVAALLDIDPEEARRLTRAPQGARRASRVVADGDSGSGDESAQGAA